MLPSGLREWFDDRSASFERGQVHEENLHYLLDDAFDQAAGWEQAVSCFAGLVEAAADSPDRLVVRAVIPLTDVDRLVAEPISIESIPMQLSDTTPPMLVLFPPELGVDHRRFEEYRVSLPFSLPSCQLALYIVARSLDYPSDGIWSRSVSLEHF